MANYFSFFPQTLYQLSDNNADVVSKITARFRFEQSFKDNTAVSYEYEIKDGDTPEIIADKLYGSPERHWIILMFNDIVDVETDWPLDQRTLMQFIEEKYKPSASAGQSGINWAQSNIQTYYIIETRTTSATGDFIETKTATDANTYANTAVTTNTITLQDGKQLTIKISKETESYYEYENEFNDSKRTIKLLKSEFIPAVENEFQSIIR
ncbi:MAG: hypothetical protein FJY17_00550 [Bacteroidetes bacterium]|nr:hypothetical protein [Bacteroidota bacterium]